MMAPKDVVTYSRTGHVGTITFDRPKANCYDLDFLLQLNAALDAASDDRPAAVVVIKSALTRFFSAGADIHAFSSYTTECKRELAELDRVIASKIEETPKLFIAAIGGHALGGGLEIALACDIRLGADGAYRIGLPEAKLGLIPGNGGTQRMARIVGQAKALELAATGECIDPREAYKIGLLNHIYPTDVFTPCADAFVKELGAGAPLAMAAAKRALREGSAMSLAKGLELEAALAETLYTTEDAVEGMAAFREKREPRYQGR